MENNIEDFLRKLQKALIVLFVLAIIVLAGLVYLFCKHLLLVN